MNALLRQFAVGATLGLVVFANQLPAAVVFTSFRSPDPFYDLAPGNAGASLDTGFSSYGFAWQFTPVASTTLSDLLQITAPLAGNSAGTVQISIWSNSGSLPSSRLGTSGTITLLNTSVNLETASLSGVPMTATQPYWIAFELTTGAGATWYGANSPNGVLTASSSAIFPAAPFWVNASGNEPAFSITSVPEPRMHPVFAGLVLVGFGFLRRLRAV